MKTEFRVVTHYKQKEFEKIVSDWLNLGWQLQGGVSTTTELSGDIIYSIAMIKIYQE